MNKVKQQAQVLLEVCKQYDRSPNEKLKEQILYLLTSLDKQIKENVK